MSPQRKDLQAQEGAREQAERPRCCALRASEAAEKRPIVFVSAAGADLHLPMRPMRKEIPSKKSVPQLESTQGTGWLSVFGPQRVLS